MPVMPFSNSLIATERPHAEVLSQGDEIMIGDVTDTNSAWLSSALSTMGLEVIRHTSVGDRQDQIEQALKEIAQRSALCISTGGLGPTVDDLTAEAVSKVFNRPLRSDPEALMQIEAWFRRYGRPMPDINRRQALIPEGAVRLDNHWGTAPGFLIREGHCLLYFLPGVPSEMRHLFNAYIAPALSREFCIEPPKRWIFHTVGIGESALQEKIAPIPFPEGIRIGFKAGGAENDLKLTLLPNATEGELVLAGRAVLDCLGDQVFAVSHGANTSMSLSGLVRAALEAQQLTLYAIETLTAGELSTALMASGCIAGALYAPKGTDLLNAYHIPGGLSGEATARLLAMRVRETQKTHLSLVQWHEAQAGDQEILLYSAVADDSEVHVEGRTLMGQPDRLRRNAKAHGLDLLRRSLNLTASIPDHILRSS